MHLGLWESPLLKTGINHSPSVILFSTNHPGKKLILLMMIIVMMTTKTRRGCQSGGCRGGRPFLKSVGGKTGERVNRANLLSDFHLLGEFEYGFSKIYAWQCGKSCKILCLFLIKKSEVSQDALWVVHNDNIFNYCILKALDVRFQMLLHMST